MCDPGVSLRGLDCHPDTSCSPSPWAGGPWRDALEQLLGTTEVNRAPPALWSEPYSFVWHVCVCAHHIHTYTYTHMHQHWKCVYGWTLAVGSQNQEVSALGRYCGLLIPKFFWVWLQGFGAPGWLAGREDVTYASKISFWQKPWNLLWRVMKFKRLGVERVIQVYLD